MTTIMAALEYEFMVLQRHLGYRRRRDGASARRLDQSAYIVMSRISREGALTIKELCGRLGLDESTLSRQTSAMIRAGYVERTASAARGAAKGLDLTDAGRQALDAERRAAAESLADGLGARSDEEWQTLMTTLRELNRGFEAADGRPWPRPASSPTHSTA